MVRAIWNGEVVAQSDDTVVIDRNHYFPADPPNPDPPFNAYVPALSDDTFFDQLTGHVTVVEFWAPWCGPCKTLHPLFDRSAANSATEALRFGRVNVDDSPGVGSAFSIVSVPTIVVFDAGGNEIDREIGLPGKRRLEQIVRIGRSLAKTP